MSANSDVRQKAAEYRDHLMSELVKVEDFIAMADRLSKSGEVVTPGPDLRALESASPHLH